MGPQTACTPAVALVFPSPSGRYLGDGSAVFDMVSGGEGYQPLQGLPVEVDGWVDDTHVAVMHVAHGFPTPWSVATWSPAVVAGRRSYRGSTW